MEYVHKAKLADSNYRDKAADNWTRAQGPHVAYGIRTNEEGLKNELTDWDF